MSDGKAVVLVVEDETIIRMGAVDVVEASGYEAVEGRDADDALSILEARVDIGLVFTDVQMPGSMDGMELAGRVHSRWPEIKIIVTSGKADIQTDSLPEGSCFISKPYSDRQIVDSIVRLLGRA